MDAAFRTLYATLMALSSAASICGNLLLLFVLLLNKELRSDALGLTLSVGLSDLLLGLSAIPSAVHNAVSWPDGYASESAVCQGGAFILVLLQTSSVHSLAWATVRKFTEVCFALSSGGLWSGWRSRAAMLLVWSVSLLSASLPLMGVGGYAYSEARFLCGPDFGPERRAFAALWTLGAVAFPVLGMCSLCAYIVYVGGKQARRGTFRCNETHCFQVPANNYLRSSIVMGTTSGGLLLCWTPFVCLSLHQTFSGLQSPPVVSALSTWLVLTSAALNPWITCLLQARYRAAVRGALSGFLLHRSALETQAGSSQTNAPTACPPDTGTQRSEENISHSVGLKTEV